MTSLGPVIAVLLLAAAGAPATASQDEQSGPTATTAPAEDAASLGAKGQWDAVATILEARSQPLAPVDAHLLAQAYRHTKRPQAAERLLENALQRCAKESDLWLLFIDLALDRGHAGRALRRIAAAKAELGDHAELALRAAKAHVLCGQLLGDAKLRRLRDAVPGRVQDGWLVVEARPREGDAAYLCCPSDSALYQIRAALESAPGSMEATALHAEIWRRLGRPETAFAALADLRTRDLSDAGPETLATCAAVALEAGELRAYLRFSDALAARTPERRDEILGRACLEAAELCCLKGEDSLYLSYLRQAVTYRPNDVDLTERLGDAEWIAERPQAARKLYQHVLTSRPSHPRRLEMLERIAAATDAPQPTDEPGERPSASAD